MFRDKGPARRGGLGRGLGALIPVSTGAVAPEAEPGPIWDVPIDSIVPNPYQPRASLHPEKLDELTESIRLHGVIQPLIVKRGDVQDRYVLIAGERRWRAAKLAGVSRVPIVLKEAAPQAMLELALVENVVRADLAPLEEAAAYRQLIEEFGLTQANIAERVGRSRVAVTNMLRLLSAPGPIQAALNAGQITEGHARALLGLPQAADQVALLQTVLDRDFTVRQTEEAVRRWNAGGGERPGPAPARDPEDVRLENRFRSALQTKVALSRNRGRAGGTLTIHYYSDEDLGGLYRRIVGDEDW
jgi:ParB family chromosome partitioning protein